MQDLIGRDVLERTTAGTAVRERPLRRPGQHAARWHAPYTEESLGQLHLRALICGQGTAAAVLVAPRRAMARRGREVAD